jgi:hypothetical protein
VIRKRLNDLMLGGLSLVGLRYLAEFSWKQAAALMLLTLFFRASTESIWRAIRGDRNPARFRVFIRPKWREILFDHGLVRDEQEWQQWLELVKTASSSEQSLLLVGFHFTVLQQDRELRSQFVFRNDSNTFVEELNVSHPIPGIKIERPHSPHLADLGPTSAWINLVWVPSFIAHNPTWGGYELSLTTPECMKSNWMESKEEPIKLAFLTALEFAGYETTEAGDDLKRWEKLRSECRRLLENRGWERIEGKSGAFGRESNRLEHKYFTVTHDSI